MQKKYNRLVFILSLAGIIVAVYVLQSFVRQSSIICVNQGCELVRKSSYSYPFGIPVPAFGLVGYTLLAILTFLRTTSTSKKLLYPILAIAIFGILFVTWFTYMELFVIRAVCTWCAISAVNMYLIFYLTFRMFNEIHRHKSV